MIEIALRWFGPKYLPLEELIQYGARTIVTSLNEQTVASFNKSIGAVWSQREIVELKKTVRNANKTQIEVGIAIESLPVSERLKKKQEGYEKDLRAYQQSIINLAKNRINLVCYNWMPIVDWTRTNLRFKCRDNSETLMFDLTQLAAYDIFMLKRDRARRDYNGEVVENAERWFRNATRSDKIALRKTILLGLPGGYGSNHPTDKSFLRELKSYQGIDNETYKKNLAYFLQEVVPVAEKHGVKLAIHPDDPPISLFGLPRVVSTEKDLADLLSAADSEFNGFTMCMGSYGVRPENNLVRMIRDNAKRLHFVHIRNIVRLGDYQFYESGHMYGDLDMNAILKAVIEANKISGEDLVVRIDHGRRLGPDLRNPYKYPGYTPSGISGGMGMVRLIESLGGEVRGQRDYLV